MPAPAPAFCGGRLRVAVADVGAQMKALPTPSRAIGSRSCQVAEPGVISADSQTSEVIAAEKPKPVINRGWTLSVSLPTHGASTIDISAIGISSAADSVGDMPRTSWA